MDYIRVKGAIHDPRIVTGVASNFQVSNSCGNWDDVSDLLSCQRSQYSAINGLMFDLGPRVGQFVKAGPQKGTNQVLRWGVSTLCAEIKRKYSSTTGLWFCYQHLGYISRIFHVYQVSLHERYEKRRWRNVSFFNFPKIVFFLILFHVELMLPCILWATRRRTTIPFYRL